MISSVYSGGKTGEDFSFLTSGYDKNGNVLGLTRKGSTTLTNGQASTFGNIDQMTYFYQGNRLQGITDAITANEDVGDFRQAPSGGSAAYSYWANGNLKSDANKGISLIEYNTFLKRVKKVTWSNGNVLNFYYDGSGTLLKKALTNDTWIYNNELIYKNSGIYQIASPEGRITPKTSGGYAYEFDYRDHQGNLRLSFRDSLAAPVNGVYAPPVITQITEQDPWGLEIKPLSYVNSVNSNNFKFQGKEELKETGWIDFGARMYDKQIGGRFLSVDPRASEMPSYSPYSSFFGNPVRYIDPDGQAPFDITLLGANNSSVTVKTDLVNLRVNASSLGVDFGGNYTLSGNDVLQAAVDIGGVFDPTPTLDILGASMSAKSGDYWGAAASGFGAAVPYVGDLAKTGKIAKGIDKISDAIGAAKGESKAFGAAVDTESKTAKQAFNNAKDQNGIPRSQQPKSQYMTPDTKTGKPLRTYDFTNSKGELKTIRKDNPVTYPDGGKQGPHYNAGKTGNKLKQHHNYE